MQITPIVSDTTLLSFRSRLVRDLAWAITLPTIVEPRWPPKGTYAACCGDPAGSRSFVVPIVSDPDYWLPERFFVDGWRRMETFLRDLDRDDTALQRALAPYEGARHGIRFERLLAFWFDSDAAIDLIDADRQVFENQTGRTQGQIDFVLGYGGETIQLEVAVKFYLDLGTASIDRYVGTDLSDRMADKLSHMLFHQRCVRSPEVAEPDRSVVSMRGTIYQPLLEANLRDNRRLPRRWWCDLALFRRLTFDGMCSPDEETPVTHWTVGGPALWFSPVLSEEVVWLAPDELEYQLERRAIPGRRIAHLVIGGTDVGETTRGFVITGP